MSENDSFGPYSEYRLRPYTAYLVLEYMDDVSGKPGYSLGCTQNHIMQYAHIKEQTWSRMKEMLDNLTNRGYLHRIEDRSSSTSERLVQKYTITKEGIEAYHRWKPVFEDWKQSSLL